VSDDRIVAPPANPMAVARQFIAEMYQDAQGPPLLRHHRNGFYRYVGDHWPEDDERRVQSELWHWLESAFYEREIKDGIELVRFEPTRYKIANVLEALKAIGHVAESTQPPAWLDGAAAVPIAAGEFVPLANGILRFSTRELIPHTPALFAQHVLPFSFDPDAPPPRRWLRFLDQLWKGDAESKATLAEIFGYVLSLDTTLQKMFLLDGPKRSGKGTIARVLTGLLGAHNTAAPTLASLTQNFGLQPLIGKPLAVVSDARIGRRADGTVAVERLLSISGEDTLTVDRKYREAWTGRLPTRFMILTNELPRFSDQSGALASRFVMLILRESFYGRENPSLTGELLEEAGGIFNWALEGLDRLRERGHFIAPASSREAQQHLEDLASPMGAFVRDICEVGPHEVLKEDLWKAWKTWYEHEGHGRPGDKTVWARDLFSAVPGLTTTRPRVGDKRPWAFRGLRLRDESGKPWTTLDREDHDDEKILVNHAPGPGWSRQETSVSSRCDHSETWKARDGKQRCLRCEPPHWPAEVIEEKGGA
jgi:putative DNA primase/helicase